jgi:GH24 family phage-related lysozyme (muramidase)
MTQQFDEGVKEILLTLFSLGASMYEANYILDLLDKRPEPIIQKIESLKQAIDKIDSPKFDAAATDAANKLSQQKPSVSKEDYINLAAKLIIPSEIYGGDINDPVNKQLLFPHLDDKGLWTIGIGHLMGDGSEAGKNKWINQNGSRLTPSQAMTLFKKDLHKHALKARNILGAAVFDKLTPQRKAVVVDIAYRGDLKPQFRFVQHLKSGKYDLAASEYLDHTEYKSRLKDGGSDGVVKRMNRNANIIRGRV